MTKRNKNVEALMGLRAAMVEAMKTTPTAACVADVGVSCLLAVAPPAVVRGWLYDPAEHWWALLVGAPPASR
jgi:hypothetical protein